MTVQTRELTVKVVGLAQGAITAGTEVAGPLIRGYLRQAVEHKVIGPEQKDQSISAWEDLRGDIDEHKPRGITEVGLNNLKGCLERLCAA